MKPVLTGENASTTIHLIFTILLPHNLTFREFPAACYLEFYSEINIYFEQVFKNRGTHGSQTGRKKANENPQRCH